MNKALAAIAIASAALAAGPVSPLPVAKPEQVGLSSERLKRVHELIDRYIKNGDIPGAVTVVLRRGKLAHLEAQGEGDLETHRPMKTDDIFRLASMTKPIAQVGALMLLEEERFQLEDPVSKYLPEFKNMKVAIPQQGGPDKIVPADREITIHDLFSHRSGLTPGRRGSGPRGPINNLDDFSKNLASQPLLFQPGAGWQYGPSTDLLGHLVEVLTGETLERYLTERIWRPLGMNDTHFRIPDEKDARLVPVYQKVDGHLKKAANLPSLKEPRFFSAAGGLVSTAPDYARFCQMLVNNGELDGHRYLSRKTIELMTAKSWPAIPIGFLKGQYFGLGVAVKDDTTDSGLLGSPGTYGWSGAYNTYFRIDPKEQLVLILMVPTTPANDMGLQYGFHNAVMQAIAD
jgi:CubicO group peptidase (beta-lactamase class C family)